MKNYLFSSIRKVPLYVIKLIQFISAVVSNLKGYARAVKLAWHLPGPEAYPIIGNCNLARQPVKIVELGKTCYDTYGGIVRGWLTCLPIIMIIEPKHLQIILSTSKHNTKMFMYSFIRNFIGEGLISSNGYEWQNSKKQLLGMFQMNKLELFMSVFTEKSNNLLKSLDQAAKCGDAINIVGHINKFVFDVMSASVFGTDTTSSPFRMGRNVFLDRVAQPWLLPEALYNLTSSYKREMSTNERVKVYVKKLIEEKNSATAIPKFSFLDMMIQANESNPSFTERNVINESITLMLAGQDSIGSAIAFTSYWLGEHQDIQQRLFEEQESIFGKSTRQPTIDDLRKMIYTEQCIKEGLRLHPSIPIFARCASEDINLGEIIIPKGCNIAIAPFITHRIPHIFEDPEKFNPDRFSRENISKIPPYAYFPFSIGSRMCLGNRFAMLEMKVLLSDLVRNYKWRVKPGFSLTMYYGVTLRARGGIWLMLEKRER